MDGGSWYCTAGSDQDHHQEKEMQKGKMVGWGARGGDGIPAELFQILKDDAVKMQHSICQQNWKPQQWSQDWKRSVIIPIPKKRNTKECPNYHTIKH